MEYCGTMRSKGEGGEGIRDWWRRGAVEDELLEQYLRIFFSIKSWIVEWKSSLREAGSVGVAEEGEVKVKESSR